MVFITNYRKIIDPDVFLSVSIDSVRTWDQFPLVGVALRYGANPNVYFDVYQLGPAHALVYAIERANKHNLPILERDALCVMLIAKGSLITNPSFDKQISAPINSSQNYNKFMIPQTTKPSTETLPTMTVEEWFGSQRLKAISNYMETLKLMGSYVPSIVGASISNKDIAFMIPEYMPTFEYLINCQVDPELFIGYPLNNGAEHVHIRRGEVVGMTQAIQGACVPAFRTFINSGVECSYFTMNRLCYHISEACISHDQVYYVILLEMLKIAIKNGAALDSKQYDMLKIADSKNKYNLISTIEEEYKTPKWSKLCMSSANMKTPEYLQKLAFSLGIDKDQSKEKICQQINAINMADPNTIKTSAINRQRARISSTISTLSEFDDTKDYKTCYNGQKESIIPEEYNDTFMSFYKDGDRVYCYTSSDYEDMIASKKEPINGNKLSPEYIRQIQSHLDIITSLGLDPSKPISITKATDMLKKKDDINMDDSDFASNTIIKILEGEKLPIPDANYSRLNDILSYQEYDYNNNLKVIDMYQDLLSKLQPSHQITTFYQAVYFVLRQDPGKTNIFLNGYKHFSTQSAKINTYPIDRTERELKIMEQAVLIQEKEPQVLTAEPVTGKDEPNIVKNKLSKDVNQDIIWVDEYGKEIHPNDLDKYHLLDLPNRSKALVQPPSKEVTLETEQQKVTLQPPPQKVTVQPTPKIINEQSQPQEYIRRPVVIDESPYNQAYYPPSKYAPYDSYANYLRNPPPTIPSLDDRPKQPEIINRKNIFVASK